MEIWRSEPISWTPKIIFEHISGNPSSHNVNPAEEGLKQWKHREWESLRHIPFHSEAVLSWCRLGKKGMGGGGTIPLLAGYFVRIIFSFYKTENDPTDWSGVKVKGAGLCWVWDESHIPIILSCCCHRVKWERCKNYCLTRGHTLGNATVQFRNPQQMY